MGCSIDQNLAKKCHDKSHEETAKETRTLHFWLAER